MAEKIRILFLAASPEDANRIRADKEAREIKERLRMAKYGEAFELIIELAIQPKDIPRALMEHQPHIVHFSGHGSKTGKLVLENSVGDSQLLEPDALAALVRILRDNVRIVVLNACFSAKQAKAISQVVDFTIGMNRTILDEAAIAFSALFYQGLAFGRSVDDAFKMGAEVGLEGIKGKEVPVLLVRDGADATKPLVVDDNRRDENLDPTSMPPVIQAPVEMLKQAIKAVPSVKYALGIVGIASAVAIITTLVTDRRVALFGIVVMIFLMTVLFIFAQAGNISGTWIEKAVAVLVWFCLLLFIATLSCLFSSVFVGRPVDLRDWIRTVQPIPQPTPSPSSSPPPNPTPVPTRSPTNNGSPTPTPPLHRKPTGDEIKSFVEREYDGTLINDFVMPDPSDCGGDCTCGVDCTKVKVLLKGRHEIVTVTYHLVNGAWDFQMSKTR